MRRLRSTTALLALLVTVSSSLTAFRCGAPPSGGGDHAGGPQHPAHAHHGSSAPEAPESRDGSGDDLGQECAVLMACGAVLRAKAAAVAQAIVPPRLDDAPLASVAKPSAADLTQDPPPPRRHA